MTYYDIGVEPVWSVLPTNPSWFQYLSGTKYMIFICPVSPATTGFTIDTASFIFRLETTILAGESTDWIDIQYRLATFERIDSNTYNIASDTGTWTTLDHESIVAGRIGDSLWQSKTARVDISSASLSVATDDYIGVIFKVIVDSGDFHYCNFYLLGDTDRDDGDYYIDTVYPSGNFDVDGIASGTWSFDIHGSQVTHGGVGGTPNQSCHTDTGTYETGEPTVDTWGVLEPQSFGVSGGIDSVYADVTFPWDTSGIYEEDVILQNNVTRTFDNPNNEYEHCSYRVQVFIGSPSIIYDIYECWWEENPAGDVYVSDEDGSDSNWGSSKSDAFKTITKGFDSVSGGACVYIDEGFYMNETAPFPDGKICAYSLWSGCKQFVVDRGSNNLENVGEIDESWCSYSAMYNTFCTNAMVVNSGLLLGVRYRFLSGYADTVELKIKVFRDGGATWDVIGESESVTVNADGTTIIIPCSINVESGDYVGIHCAESTALMTNVNGSYTEYIYANPTDLTGSIPKSSVYWGTYNRECAIEGFVIY